MKELESLCDKQDSLCEKLRAKVSDLETNLTHLTTKRDEQDLMISQLNIFKRELERKVQSDLEVNAKLRGQLEVGKD